MTWRTCPVSPARTWTICGALADRRLSEVAMSAEERAYLIAEGVMNEFGRLTASGFEIAALSPEEVSFRMRQWKLHQVRS